MAKRHEDAGVNFEELEKRLDGVKTTQEIEELTETLSRAELEQLAKQYLEMAIFLQERPAQETVLANPNENYVIDGTGGSFEQRRKHAAWVAGELTRLKNS